MPIEFAKRYTREEIKANPDTLYVFGDNMRREGMGGQAAEARYEPNAVGIPTKWSPAAFFDDISYRNAVYQGFYPAFILLKYHLDTGGVIVWPADDIGTGLADLQNKAPRIWKRLQELKTDLFKHGGLTNAQDQD